MVKKNYPLSFQNPEHVRGLLEYIQTDEMGLSKALTYNIMCLVLFFGVSRDSFEQLIKIHSAEDTDPDTWRLRSVIWESFLVFNGVFKLGPVKHVPPLTMFCYAEQPFPVTLTSVAPIDRENSVIEEYMTAEVVMNVEDKPWVFLECNLEFLKLEVNCLDDDEFNLLTWAHFVQNCASNCARQLSEVTGVKFVAKPIDSFLDKLFYRQLDIHDMVRTRVFADQMDGIVNQLEEEMNCTVFERKKTKNGRRSVILLGQYKLPDVDQNGPVWIEVQEDAGSGAGDTHMEYEIGRMVRSSRYQSLLGNDPNFRELDVPHMDLDEEERVMDYLGAISGFHD